ncbi:MAG: MotA/TolQ/ExbB proton channel family protein [Pseudomonadota bacterium]|nr:MotA/TolQ/ExbB proton channel family protein [Pseudomonadota bacterium]
MKTLKIAGLSLLAGVAALGIELSAAVAQETAPAPAQPAKPQLTLDQVLQAVRRERSSSSQENREREQRFLAERNNQAALLNQVKAQVAAEEAKSTRLEGQLDENQKIIDQLSAELADKQGEFGDLFGAARSAAADLNAQVSGSIISAEFPGRGEALTEIAQSDTLPSDEQLELLWYVLMQQMTEQAKVAKFQAPVIQANGESSEAAITRVGPFVAISRGNYLTYDSGAQKLKFLPRQPSGPAKSAASRVENASGDKFVTAVIDPSLGQLLSVIVETPNFKERVDQGGEIGYATIILSLIAFALGVLRFVQLSSTAGAVRAQMRRGKPSKSNPLGRVLLAYEENKNADVETVQLKLDDAILHEIPKLESGLNFVKLIAAVAPLMGLLGTVSGMINTFQAITLYGTGDPQIMASGISEALVTTVIGLVSAIPLLLLHAFASGASKRVIQILEEQSAGIIARHAQGGR